ncbi:MAG: anti-sigma factor domain-containing protein, partial [Clostridia bacterium]
MSRRAVVLEVGPEHAVVLLEGGEVRRLPTRDASMASVVPGQEIWVPVRNSPRLDHAWGRA